MSRSGYSDDCENLELYRRAVENAIHGKRGQHFLRDLAAALDAMPVKRLIVDQLRNAEGEVCALGCLGIARKMDVTALDPDEPDDVARAFGIARSLAAEVSYMNDEYVTRPMTAEERWFHIRAWVASNIRAASPGAPTL